ILLFRTPECTVDSFQSLAGLSRGFGHGISRMACLSTGASGFFVSGRISLYHQFNVDLDSSRKQLAGAQVTKTVGKSVFPDPSGQNFCLTARLTPATMPPKQSKVTPPPIKVGATAMPARGPRTPP